jgi:hypothetical protein
LSGGNGAARWAAALAAGLLVALLWYVPAGAQGATRIEAGADLLQTRPSTQITFKGLTTLPAGFFGPESRPFKGTVELEGVPLGRYRGVPTGLTDTIVRRLETAVLPRPTGRDTIPIQLVELSLRSVAPLEVTVGGAKQRWELTAVESRIPQPRGTLTATGRDPAGGTANTVLPVLPRLTFTRVGDREQRALDLGELPDDDPIRTALVLRGKRTPFTYSMTPGILSTPLNDGGFCPGCPLPLPAQVALARFKDCAYVFEASTSTYQWHCASPTEEVVSIPGGNHPLYSDGTELELPEGVIGSDFFNPGSDPVSGTVGFAGEPLGTFDGKDVGDADTIVRRRRAAVFGSGLGSDMIPIELVRLSLGSSEPVAVTTGGSTELWDVRASVSRRKRSNGTMTIRKRDQSGGTFDSRLTVYPLLTFTSRADGNTKRLDLGAVELPRAVASGLVVKARNAPWQTGCREPALPVRGMNDYFCPAFGPKGEKQVAQRGALLRQGLLPAQAVGARAASGR